MPRSHRRLVAAAALGGVLAAPLAAVPATAAEEPLSGEVHYASDLDWTSMENGWGPVERDMSNGSRAAEDDARLPLTVGGTVYEKGLGAHAPSSIVYDLDGQCRQFLSFVGVDDGQGGKGHVTFDVLVDGENAASVETSGGQPASPVNIDLTGVSQVELSVDPGPEGNGNDHADWADARFNCTDSYLALPLVITAAEGTSLNALVPGEPATVDVTGLAPLADVSLTLGEGTVADGTADESGVARITFVVPADAESGTASLSAEGTALFDVAAQGSREVAIRNISTATYYLDCSAEGSGDGSEGSPFTSTEEVNDHGDFAPGEKLLVRRGTECVGALAPTGSGTDGNPITIAPYGDGDAPTIDGNGAVAAVHLVNVSNWTVTGLHVINPADETARRVGILYESIDSTPKRGIVIDDNHVENVAGWSNKTGPHSDWFSFSSGIMVVADSGTGAYDGITITGNTINDAGGGGIKITGDTGTYNTDVYVAQNTISRVGGDGIVIHNSDAPLIEHNAAYDLGLGDYPYLGGNFAGMWPYNSKNPTFQFNVVGNSTTSIYDATAWDCDIDTVGTCLFQYNYSYGNGGGFYLDCVSGCGTSSTETNVVLRYNVAQDDCRLAGASGGPGKHYIYNNVFYCPSRGFVDDMTAPRYVANNVIVAPSGSLKTENAEYETNAYAGGIAPPESETDAVTGDLGFVAAGSGQHTMDSLNGYTLLEGSPLLSAGTPIEDAGDRDLFGNAIPATPNIGAYQGAGVAASPLPFSSLVNQTAVTNDENPRAGAITPDRRTYSAEALADAGLVIGEDATVTDEAGTEVDVAWHPTEVGTPDVVKSAGQTVAIDASGQTLAVVGFSTGTVYSGTFTVTYTDGTSEKVEVSLAPWRSTGAAASRAASSWNASYSNQHTQEYIGDASTVLHVDGTVTVSSATAAIDGTKTVASVTLPQGSPFIDEGLSLFGIAVGGGSDQGAGDGSDGGAGDGSEGDSGVGSGDQDGGSSDSSAADGRTGTADGALPRTGAASVAALALLAMLAIGGGLLLRRRRA